MQYDIDIHDIIYKSEYKFCKQFCKQTIPKIPKLHKKIKFYLKLYKIDIIFVNKFCKQKYPKYTKFNNINIIYLYYLNKFL